MDIVLRPVCENELPELLRMQHESFQELLERYRDYETNPAAETLEMIRSRFAQQGTRYFFVVFHDEAVGGIRVVHELHADHARISPMFIVPAFQNAHLGKAAVMLIEREYPFVRNWKLETILQESRLCRFYEKLGYADTGQRFRIKEGMDLVFYKKEL